MNKYDEKSERMRKINEFVREKVCITRMRMCMWLLKIRGWFQNRRNEVNEFDELIIGIGVSAVRFMINSDHRWSVVVSSGQ